MPNCLGIYIDRNLIKYAKVSREANNIKVEAYGTKVYEENIEKAIGQIIKETYSYSAVPISMNLNNVQYTYSNLFSLLNKNDLKKAIDTEFDYFCSDNAKNRNVLEYRTIETQDIKNPDKKRIIYAYADRTNIVERIQMVEGYKPSNILPMGMTIANLLPTENTENSLIVNIENETEITTVVNGVAYKVDKIEKGMEDIIGKIAAKENSYAKAYEICKNTTIYTSSEQNLQVEENEYLPDILSFVFDIIQKIKKIIQDNEIEISNIYITGMGAVINNIDLLFQENFMQNKCEILTPFFIERTNLKINIKDYIEVNSAISIALQTLGIGSKGLNFGKEKKSLKEILTSDVDFKSKKNGPKIKLPFKEKLKYDINADADTIERALLRIVTSLAMLIIVYVGASKILEQSINAHIDQTQTVIENTDAQIAKMQEYTKLVNTRTSDYQDLVNRYNELNNENNELISSKNAIPNLLHEIMNTIPKQVQILSIKNTTGKHIVIEAQVEEDYAQLGYFKAKLSQEGVLWNIVVSSGSKENGFIKVSIEGDLPY